MLDKKKEVKPRYRLWIVRSWLPIEGEFRFYQLSNDGAIKPSNSREAKAYTKQFKTTVTTIIGEPTETTWAGL